MENNKAFAIWGAAGHALVLADVLDFSGHSVIALFDNNPNALSCLPGVKLYIGESGFFDWLSLIPNRHEINAAIAIGGARGKDRQHIANTLIDAGLNLPSIIHPRATVAKSAEIGKGCHILANAVVAPSVSMGNVCIINNLANVDHECKLGHGVHIAPGAVLCGCVHVGDNVMIGAGACVLPNVSIGANTIIGAGAVVTRNIPPGSVVIGNPARRIRSI